MINYKELLKQTLNDNEEKGLRKLFTMMIALRQQVLLRSKQNKG